MVQQTSAVPIPVVRPIFIDVKGKRWKRICISVSLFGLAIIIGAAWLVDEAFSPVWTVEKNQPSDYPVQALQQVKGSLPIIGAEGEGNLTRVDLVKKINGQTQLIDPFTDQVIRLASEEEAQEIGNNQYVLEWYGTPADHVLMLTFDDGPNALYTPEILDILSREHVQATFFVVGQQVIQNQDLLKRIIREGHMVGNHTLTHVGFNNGTIRDREEMIGADRVIRTVGDYTTRLFRIPEGDPDHSERVVLQAQQLGYIDMDMDMDTQDWRYAPGETIPVPELDGRGHVVLLHDGGGDRSGTIDLLERLIKEAKAQGYSFSTVAPLLPKEMVPSKHATLSAGDYATSIGMWVFLVLPAKIIYWLFVFGVSTLTIITCLYVLLALVQQYRQKRQTWTVSEGDPPFVSVIIAAYNEAKVLRRTLEELHWSVYPNFEVIVVNDGSTDKTQEVLEQYASEWSMLRVACQDRNMGKAAALNRAIEMARGDIIVTQDADTILEPQTISMLARHFRNPKVTAVAGHVKVGNRRNILTAWQSLEYLSGICVTRMAEGLLGAISIVPGACAAWRKEAVIAAGGYSGSTLAEDSDLTLSIQKRGGKIVQDNKAVAWTEAPLKVRPFGRQRLRWMVGNLQAYRKHWDMILRPKYGVLGMVSLPYAVLSILVPLLFMPLTYIAMVINLVNGSWQSTALFAGFVLSVHAVVSLVAISMVREKPWHLLVVPVYRLIYEPLRAYLLYASLLRIAKGREVGKWYHLERTGTV